MRPWGCFGVRRQFLGRGPEVELDIDAIRHTRVAGVLIPWLFITMVLFFEWLRLWFN